jgi:hypothetical protein
LLDASGMTLHEVPPLEWIDVLERFSREHHAWLATVKRQPRGRPEAVLAEERPLQAVEAGISGLSVEAVVIRVAGEAPMQIEKPTSLRVAQSAEGLHCGLDIATGDAVTSLRFRAAALPEQLDGAAPGELR